VREAEGIVAARLAVIRPNQLLAHERLQTLRKLAADVPDAKCGERARPEDAPDDGRARSKTARSVWRERSRRAKGSVWIVVGLKCSERADAPATRRARAGRRHEHCNVSRQQRIPFGELCDPCAVRWDGPPPADEARDQAVARPRSAPEAIAAGCWGSWSSTRAAAPGSRASQDRRAGPACRGSRARGTRAGRGTWALPSGCRRTRLREASLRAARRACGPPRTSPACRAPPRGPARRTTAPERAAIVGRHEVGIWRRTSTTESRSLLQGRAAFDQRQN
jgi:hypothetical protein